MRTVTFRKGIFSITLSLNIPPNVPEFQIQMYFKLEEQKWLEYLENTIYDYCLN
jgi:hypothetical protein